MAAGSPVQILQGFRHVLDEHLEYRAGSLQAHPLERRRGLLCLLLTQTLLLEPLGEPPVASSWDSSSAGSL